MGGAAAVAVCALQAGAWRCAPLRLRAARLLTRADAPAQVKTLEEGGVRDPLPEELDGTRAACGMGRRALALAPHAPLRATQRWSSTRCWCRSG